MKYPAKEHARKVAAHLKAKNPGLYHDKPLWMLSATKPEYYPHCDQTKPFRQDRYFFYITGCPLPNTHIAYDTIADHLTLYLPLVDKADVMWSGMPILIKQAMEMYDVDKVKYVDIMAQDFANTTALTISTPIALDEQVATLNADEIHINIGGYLHPDLQWAFNEARLIKDAFEIELMRKAAAMTDKCHLAVMKAAPMEHNEAHLHAEFAYHAIRQGSKSQAYDPICCLGPACLTLHYTRNDEDILPEKRLVLLDAGCEYQCYASDVTRSFPINGDWTKEHLNIYKAVQRMQRVTMEQMRPGASWEDLHLHAHRVLIEEFLELGLFKKEYLPSELFRSNVLASFFPHGLGHLLGLDTHDVGGRANYDDPDPKLCYLRLRRPLQAGMVVTNEPGIYFSPFLLEQVLKGPLKKYIDEKELNKYWAMGGVRIEDDILITEKGYENLTGITLDWKEISDIVKGSQ